MDRLTEPLTVELVKAYAAKRGQNVSVSSPASTRRRQKSLVEDGHRPLFHIACIDGDGDPVLVITYIPAAVAVPQAV